MRTEGRPLHDGVVSRPKRSRKVTSVESPSAMVRRAQALLDFCEQHELGQSHRRLLREVLDGHRGPALAYALGVEPSELDDLRRSFEAHAGQSVYDAAIDVLTAAREKRGSSFPPPDTGGQTEAS